MTENGKHNEDDYRRANKVLSILKFAVLLLIVVGLPLYLFLFQRDTLMQLKDLEYVEQLIMDHKKTAWFFYMGSQIIQILISVVPGQALQFAAGYCFGIPVGLALSIIGAGLGTFITFYLGKILGRDAMHVIIPEDKIEHYTARINSKNGIIIIFLLYLIPGLPKDTINYIGGISDIRFLLFFPVSMMGRIPGMLGSLIIGWQLKTGSYMGAAIVGAVAVVLFLLGVGFRKPLMERIDRWYDIVAVHNEENK